MLGEEELGQPYYIVSPPYEVQSAGVRSLHLLCHALNVKSFQAYLVQDPSSYGAGLRMKVNSALRTPILTSGVIDRHLSKGRTPVIVYPEIVPGNPYDAGCVIRYVLNFPGLLSGDKLYPPHELCFGYSHSLASAAGAPSNVLYIPPVDTDVFYPPKDNFERVGTCFYADKFRYKHGGTPGAVTADSVEITRLQPGSQTPEQIAALFRRSKLFYTYENTSLAIEAVLCGCPAVFIPNAFLSAIIASAELGSDGYAWGTEPNEIERAASTVGRGAKAYLDKVDAFWAELDAFIEKTQRHAITCQAGKLSSIPRVSELLPITEEKTLSYPSLVAAVLLLPLRLLPQRIEGILGSILSRVGLTEAGSCVRRSAGQKRSSRQVIYIEHAMLQQTRLARIGKADSP